MNSYSGVPHAFSEIVEQEQSRALEIDIREAMGILTEGRAGRLDAVVNILAAIVGDDPLDRPVR